MCLPHSSTAPLSKRAQSTTLTSLPLESIIYEFKIESKVICAPIVPQPCRRLHIFYPAIGDYRVDRARRQVGRAHFYRDLAEALEVKGDLDAALETMRKAQSEDLRDSTEPAKATPHRVEMHGGATPPNSDPDRQVTLQASCYDHLGIDCSGFVTNHQ